LRGNRFLEHALAHIVGATFPDFDDVDRAQAELAAGLLPALAVTLGKLCFRTAL
jgi:hypothetical protein